MNNLHEIKIFLVDDDIFQLHLLKQILLMKGCRDICIYENIDEFIFQIYTKPTLIFLDFHLGNNHGFDLLEKIKRYDSEINVVVIIDSDDQKSLFETNNCSTFGFVNRNKDQKEQIACILNKIQTIRILKKNAPSLN